MMTEHTAQSAQTALYEFLVTRGLPVESDGTWIRVDTGHGPQYKILVSFGHRSKHGRLRPTVLCAEVAGYGRHMTVSYMVDPNNDWMWKVDARIRLLLGPSPLP